MLTTDLKTGLEQSEFSPNLSCQNVWKICSFSQMRPIFTLVTMRPKNRSLSVLTFTSLDKMTSLLKGRGRTQMQEITRQWAVSLSEPSPIAHLRLHKQCTNPHTVLKFWLVRQQQHRRNYFNDSSAPLSVPVTVTVNQPTQQQDIVLSGMQKSLIELGVSCYDMPKCLMWNQRGVLSFFGFWEIHFLHLAPSSLLIQPLLLTLGGQFYSLQPNEK